jgi:hypothetical protein
MATVARWARRQLRLLTPPAYRRGRHRAGAAPGVGFALYRPTSQVGARG